MYCQYRSLCTCLTDWQFYKHSFLHCRKCVACLPVLIVPSQSDGQAEFAYTVWYYSDNEFAFAFGYKLWKCICEWSSPVSVSLTSAQKCDQCRYCLLLAVTWTGILLMLINTLNEVVTFVRSMHVCGCLGLGVCLHYNLKNIEDNCFLLGSYADWRKLLEWVCMSGT